jgi:3-dehydro-L-gulonate-6-phosphate decarboxylase
MAKRVAREVDIIEVGTPLCKAVGMQAVRAMRDLCPDRIILADMKTPDVGAVEARIAFDAGADWMTVIGGAAPATIKAALEEAKKRGREMLVELTGVRDVLAVMPEWKQMGVERVVYHREWDAEATGREWAKKDLDVIQGLLDMGFKVTVTGGITAESIPFFQGLPIAVFVVGRSICEAKDPVGAARQIRGTINRLWRTRYLTDPKGHEGLSP